LEKKKKNIKKRGDQTDNDQKKKNLACGNVAYYHRQYSASTKVKI